jgi:hypothetical protein
MKRVRGTMRRFLVVMFVALTTVGLATPAWAGNAHFLTTSVTRADDTLTVVGKEAGLGDEDQVHIVVTATAQCVNPGGHDPQAGNKMTVSAGEDVPVQNGKADFSVDLVATFQPDCAPPMTVVFSDVVVTDTTNGLTVAVPGTF